MVTHTNYEKLKGLKGLNVISALTHKEIKKLKEREIIQLGLFDERNIVEVAETDGSGLRCCLCKNPFVAQNTTETRPVFHKTDLRIRSHVFICMLSYYLEWHLLKKLKELFKEDFKGRKRRWTKKLVIERLKSIRRNKCKFYDVESEIITEPDEEQKELLDLLEKRYS